MRASRFAVGATGLVAVLSAGVGTATAGASSGGWVPTHTRALTKIVSAPTTTELGPLAAATPMRIDVVLPVRRKGALTARVLAEANPSNAAYEHYMTARQFRAQFSPTEATVSAVTGYLESQGFTQVSVDANGLMVTADGTAAQVETAFDTTLDQFAILGDATHPVYANVTAASVPEGLSGDVAAVLGLNDFQASDQPQVASPKTPLSGYYPKEFQTVYDATGTATGSNTTIAVIAEGDLAGVLSDLRYAEAQQQLPRVPVTIVRTGPATTDTSGADEWDLDTQVSTGMAQTVKRLYIYDMPTMTDTDLAHAINTWAGQDVAREGSASIGLPDILPFLDGSMLAIDTSVEESAVQGQTFFASTGDTGASCAIEDTNGVPDSGVPAQLCYPADGTWTTAVGGTTLVTDSSDNYMDELAWNAGGGGVSDLEYPGPWTDNANPASAAGARGDPDIAMDADLTTGCLVYVDKTAEVVGGTSVSSPLAMGAYARVQSAYTNTLGDGVLQFYRLYNNANPSAPRTNATPGFHDIIAGSNGGYAAAPGWDYTTGIGSIDVAALIKAFHPG